MIYRGYPKTKHILGFIRSLEYRITMAEADQDRLRKRLGYIEYRLMGWRIR